MEQIDAAPVFANENDADGEAAQVKGSKVGIFFERGKTADESGKQRHQHSCNYAAQAHRGQAQACKHITDGCSGKDGVTQCVTYQAHSPHDEEYADRSGTKGKAEGGCEGVAHKVKFCKGCDKQVVGSHSVWYGDMVLDGIMKRTSQGFPVSASWHWLGQDRLPSVWFQLHLPQFFHVPAA